MQRNGKIIFSERVSHFKRSGRVHIGSNNGDTGVFDLAVAQRKRSD